MGFWADLWLAKHTRRMKRAIERGEDWNEADEHRARAVARKHGIKPERMK